MLKGYQFLIIEWALVLLTLVWIVCRYSIRLQKRNYSIFSLSDAFLFLGWALYISQVIIDSLLLSLRYFDYGSDVGNVPQSGHHLVYSNIEDEQMLLKLVYIKDILYYCAMYSIKAAMLAFYYELINVHRKKLRIALHIITITVATCWAVTFCITSFYCSPISLNWSLEADFCSATSSTVANAVRWGLHMFTDLQVWILPIFAMDKIRLSMRLRIGVIFIWFIGLISITLGDLYQVADYAGWDEIIEWLFASLEITLAIFAACGPAFKVILQSKKEPPVITKITMIHNNESMVDIPLDTEDLEKNRLSNAGSENGSQKGSQNGENPLRYSHDLWYLR